MVSERHLWTSSHFRLKKYTCPGQLRRGFFESQIHKQGKGGGEFIIFKKETTLFTIPEKDKYFFEHSLQKNSERFNPR